MRKFLPLTALLLATACGGADQREARTSDDLKTYDVSNEPSADMAVPGIAPTAAPGVAFNYRYAFRLPSERVASVQEQHAQACERLGLARCRITGMRYRLMNDRDIEAMLAFKLDPSIARQFGKSGIEAVSQAEGMLVDSEITGVDAGSAIRSANRNEAQLNADLRRIEARLAQRGLPAEERTRLETEAMQLRNTIRANQANREEQEESLATTPMVFHYGSGDLVPGFDTRSPIAAALERASDNFVSGFAALLVILLTLLPWAAVLLLVWWTARKLFPRLRLGEAPAET